jgi:hypothetical protein
MEDLAYLIRRRIRDRYLDEGVRPELHIPEQSEGEIHKLGLFPNLNKRKRATPTRPAITRDPATAPAVNRQLRDTWQERDRLELYVIACLSVGVEATLPVEQEPQLSRLRFLKDAIVSGELEATLARSSPDAPDVWATVTRSDLEFFAKARKHGDLVQLVQKWKQTERERPDVRSADVKAGVLLRLAELRREGVKRRNAATELTLVEMVELWIEWLERWQTEVFNEIARISPADAEMWSTLDVVPNPRIELPSYVNDAHFHAYRQLDFFLVKLKDLIDIYGGQSS